MCQLDNIIAIVFKKFAAGLAVDYNILEPSTPVCNTAHGLIGTRSTVLRSIAAIQIK